MTKEADAAREAEISAGVPDATASDSGTRGGLSGGEADVSDGALSPGSTATGNPTSNG